MKHGCRIQCGIKGSKYTVKFNKVLLIRIANLVFIICMSVIFFVAALFFYEGDINTGYFITVFASCLGAVISGVITLYSIKTSSDNLNKQIELSDKPFIKLVHLETRNMSNEILLEGQFNQMANIFDESYDGSDVRVIPDRIQFHNIGKGPALGVKIVGVEYYSTQYELNHIIPDDISVGVNEYTEDISFGYIFDSEHYKRILESVKPIEGAVLNDCSLALTYEYSDINGNQYSQTVYVRVVVHTGSSEEIVESNIIGYSYRPLRKK